MPDVKRMVDSFLIVFVVAVTGCGSGTEPPQLEEATPPPAVFSGLSYSEALSEANTSGKMLVVFATADWSPQGEAMEESVWTDDSVVAWVNQNAIAIRADAGDDPELREQLGVKLFPTTIVYRNGQEYGRLEGEKTAQQLLQWLKTMA
jgi:hypothetical protein